MNDNMDKNKFDEFGSGKRSEDLEKEINPDEERTFEQNSQDEPKKQAGPDRGSYYNPNQGFNPGAYRPPNQNSTGWNSGGWQPGGQWQQEHKHPYGQRPYRFNAGEYDDVMQKGRAKRKNRGLAVFGSIIAGIMAISIISFAAYGVYSLVTNNSSTSEIPYENPQDEITDGPSININDSPNESLGNVAPGTRMTNAQVYQNISPSIVGISVYYETSGFSRPAIGSGIIMSEDGYIVTNAHVVENGVGINVTLANGENYEARLVGMDKRTDLAVVKIDASGLSYATFGNSDQINVGDDVLAIGSPAGLDGSMSKGIISAKEREIQLSDGAYSIECVQTDAAISPGISGGALVNMYGQVIGITSAKLVNEDIEGIGFAIPINNAKPIVDDLIKNGRVTGRVRLGITAQAIDEATAAYNNVLPGIVVVSTDQGSDISKKGVRPGDIIFEVNNKKVKSFDDMGKALNGFKAGDSVEIKVYRPAKNRTEAKTFTVSVKVIEAGE